LQEVFEVMNLACRLTKLLMRALQYGLPKICPRKYGQEGRFRGDLGRGRFRGGGDLGEGEI
jgi:hypothetical protein